MRPLPLALSLLTLTASLACTPGGGGDRETDDNDDEDGDEGEGEGESPSDALCILTYECAGEDDPAAACQQARDDLDEDDRACAETCRPQGDAYASCYLENARCEDEALSLEPADACDDEAEPLFDCYADC